MNGKEVPCDLADLLRVGDLAKHWVKVVQGVANLNTKGGRKLKTNAVHCAQRVPTLLILLSLSCLKSPFSSNASSCEFKHRCVITTTKYGCA